VTERDLTAIGNVSKAGHTNIYGTPLHAAVYAANPEASDVYLAIRFDKIRVIEALLAHGANINARLSTEEPRGPGQRYRVTLTGATPFLLAAKASDVDLMRLLLAHGADPNIETFDHQTALMAAAGIAWAANQDQATDRTVLEAVEMLVNELHADVNHVSDRKETPMHAAAYRGANYLVEFLTKKGARLDAKDRNGRTPAMVADGVAYGNAFAAHPDTAALLRSLEAVRGAQQ
jgi:ankyrin repeat protein